MENEQTIKFGEICEHSAFGPRFSSDEYAVDGNVGTLRTTDISADGRIELSTMPIARLDLDRFKQHVLKRDDLVITRTGRVGTTAVFTDFRLPVIPGAFLIRFRLNRSVANPKFYCYFFNSAEGQSLIKSVATGSVQQNLNITSLHTLPVPFPSLSEQDSIAHILGTLDDKIELNRRMNETLEAMARALFKSWFVDFDPVRAKAEGRPPAGMDADTAALFPEGFEDSVLGEVPRGWSVETIGDIAINPRRSVQPNEIAENTPYIGLEHMPRRSIALSDWEESADVVSGKSAFHKGEILFGKLRPYFHKVGVAPIDGVCSTDILVIAPKSADWFGFLLGHCSSNELVQFTDLASTGTKMPRTNWSDIGAFKIVVPPQQLVAAFTQIIEPMISQIMTNLHQSHTLSRLRDTLLPKLLSGELQIP